MMIPPHLIPIVGAALFSALVFLALIRLPRGFKKSFGPAIYIMPIMGAWGTYLLLNWVYLLNPVVPYVLVFLVPVFLVGLFVLKFITLSTHWARRRIGHIHHEANNLAIPPLPPAPPQLPQNAQSNTHREDYFSAPLIQNWDGGGWRPTPIIKLGRSVPLTGEWVSIDINTPERVRQGEILAVRADISNGHSSRPLNDKGVLEIVFPTGTKHGYGPDAISLQPNGDTISLYYTWRVPFLPGNYILRYHLVGLQSMTEKVLVVE